MHDGEHGGCCADAAGQRGRRERRAAPHRAYRVTHVPREIIEPRQPALIAQRLHRRELSARLSECGAARFGGPSPHAVAATRPDLRRSVAGVPPRGGERSIHAASACRVPARCPLTVHGRCASSQSRRRSSLLTVPMERPPTVSECQIEAGVGSLATPASPDVGPEVTRSAR